MKKYLKETLKWIMAIIGFLLLASSPVAIGWAILSYPEVVAATMISILTLVGVVEIKKDIDRKWS